VNRRDKESHETEECKFRKITCESCDEELVYVDYEKHQCTLRKEMNEVKSRLDEVTESLKQVVLTQGEMLEKLTAHNLQNPLHHFSSATIPRDSAVNIKGQIFIFSGKSLEVFNWSTKAWTLIENCLFFSHTKSFSFLYGKRIMVCNGRIDPSLDKRIKRLFRMLVAQSLLHVLLFHCEGLSIPTVCSCGSVAWRMLPVTTAFLQEIWFHSRK
jgi:hypothetical protein